MNYELAFFGKTIGKVEINTKFERIYRLKSWHKLNIYWVFEKKSKILLWAY